MEKKMLYETDKDFSGYTSDIKPIALYLPQFHEIPENNAWWGEGFTEWTNVKKAQPRYKGHDQPRIPDESFGYYDLTDAKVLQRQADLARKHGVYAFGVYYYWFSGKRLLEKPMDILLEHPEIDFPFFLIWANENWSRRWDGKEADILIGQEYSKDDPEKFIRDLKKYMDDPRYMRVDGKPVIGIYNPIEVPHAADVLKAWRKAAEEMGIGEIQIWSCVTDTNAEAAGITAQVDAEYEFPPRGKGFVSYEENKEGGVIWNYGELVESAKNYSLDNDHPVYRGTMLSWDNSARKKRNYHVWKGYTPQLFYKWNRIAINYTRRHFPADKRFIFINAWNEWGEGTYLEPDNKYGFAAINALSKAIFDLPYDEETPILINDGFQKAPGWDRALTESANIAIQIHFFYPDLIPELFSRLTNVQYPFDLYVTTDTQYKAECFQKRFAEERALHHCVRALQVDVCENRGRDVIPFLEQLRPVYGKYKYFCHIHTKKSKHSNTGDVWRQYLFEGLLGDQRVVDDILYMMESDPSVGIVYPQIFSEIESFMEWGSNKNISYRVAKEVGIEIKTHQEKGREKLIFPAGDMFWAKTEAVRQLLGYPIPEEDIPPEKGQLDGTIMHAIERLWCYTAMFNGYRVVQTENPFEQKTSLGDPEANMELIHIRNSRMWRLALKYYRVRDALLPKGSAIREIVKKVVRLFRR